MFVLEIEKIKKFIEKHSKELAFEVYGAGGFIENVTCEINSSDKDNPMLTVYGMESGKSVELFCVCENWFKEPTKKQLDKLVQNSRKQLNEDICHHWCVHTLENGTEQFVLSALSLDNYLKACEIRHRFEICARHLHNMEK